ncbi:TetR/AcrR family transcriptional regulator [soil metagenome]
MQVFGSKGYRQGSLAEVAELVGMTHAGVLHHFGSKDQLLTEVLRYRDRVDVQHLQGQHIPGGMELFRHLIITAALNADRRGIVQAYSVLAGEAVTDDHPASAFVTQRFAGLRDDIATALRATIAERRDASGVDLATNGDTRDPDLDLDAVATAIIGAMDGVQTQLLLDPDAVDLVEATSFAIEAILTAALAGPRRVHPLD